MGLFSWITQDTNRSIPCEGASRPTFKVTMTDNLGNKWTEENYQGYGVFGGKDFYELLAEMNGLRTREEGIDLYFDEGDFRSPNLDENPSQQWMPEAPEQCEYQGFLYPRDEGEDFNY